MQIGLLMKHDAVSLFLTIIQIDSIVRYFIDYRVNVDPGKNIG